MNGSLGPILSQVMLSMSCRCSKQILTTPLQSTRELGFAQGLGFKRIRVFLHNLLWEEDPTTFVNTLDSFLNITSSLVLDCKLGNQSLWKDSGGADVEKLRRG